MTRKFSFAVPGVACYPEATTAQPISGSAKKMRTSRQKAGITQAEVARILGRPQSFVSKIETGERRVGFLEIQLLAHIYGEPLSYFEDAALARHLPHGSS